jgi:hypothetical protein
MSRRRRSRTLAPLVAILGVVAGAALTVRQRQLAKNAKRFGLPI